MSIDRIPNARLALVPLAALALVGCAALEEVIPGGQDGEAALAEADYVLQLLHLADMDGASGALEDVGAFSALAARFREDFPDNTLLVSSGDNYIPGPRYFAASADALAGPLGAAGDGRADIAFLNEVGVVASAVGNHELDQGTGAFAALVAPETVGTDDEDGRPAGDYPGAAFPYLSANLDFTADEALAPLATEGGQAADAIGARLAPSAVVEIDGATIGLVGATTPGLGAITSAGDIGVRPADADDVDALAAEIQSAVDALVERGVNKVVLLAHMQQISVERALATRLANVDIIVAGGSNTFARRRGRRPCAPATRPPTSTPLSKRVSTVHRYCWSTSTATTAISVGWSSVSTRRGGSCRPRSTRAPTVPGPRRRRTSPPSTRRPIPRSSRSRRRCATCSPSATATSSDARASTSTGDAARCARRRRTWVT